MRSALFLILALFPILASAQSPATQSLAGNWLIRLDPGNQGVSQNWFSSSLGHDTIALPGILEAAGYGTPTSFASALAPRKKWICTALVDVSRVGVGNLVFQNQYIGPAWYQRQIDIPPAWQGRYIRLTLERCLWSTQAWLDDRPLGSRDSLLAPHRYDLGFISPGQHRLTIRVDNSQQVSIGIMSHSYGDETQGRWNGIVGRIDLRATDPVFIESLQVYPDAASRRLRCRAIVVNHTPVAAEGALTATIPDLNWTAQLPLRVLPGRQAFDVTATGPQAPELWDEFHPHLYQAQVTLSTRAGATACADQRDTTFGFRTIARDGRHILINGHPVFWRGTLDCAVYPKTAHPPMTVAAWTRIFTILRQYGLNHVRYHSWCPPEEAFIAADRLGFYLHVESPYWFDNWMEDKPEAHLPPFGKDPKVTRFIVDEIRRMQDAYGNHPSFCLLLVGNEIGSHSDYPLLEQIVADARVHDPRHLYSIATARQLTSVDDVYVSHATPGGAARGVGPGHTDWDFSKAVHAIDKPLIAHETGQFAVFPNFAEIDKYTGPLKPYDLMLFRDRMKAAGLLDLDKAFTHASGRWTFLQYREEIEAFERTPDYNGFQLLALNDFTGQGNALVGILDPFWDSKGICTPAEWRRFCAPTVPLLRFARRTWARQPAFTGNAEIIHFGPADLKAVTVIWTARASDGATIAHGSFGPLDIPTGTRTPLGPVTFDLSSVKRPARINIELSIPNTDIANDWNIWCYSADQRPPDPGNVLVAASLNANATQALAAGKPVLLLADRAKGPRIARTKFHSVYWSASMFPTPSATLGLLVDQSHPALAQFPTESHCDWQWQHLCEGGAMFNLDGLPADLHPIVQPIPDFHFIHRLGTVFEARVGDGRLMVCGYDLRDLTDKPARRQLLRSLLAYMNSPQFTPRVSLTESQLHELLGE